MPTHRQTPIPFKPSKDTRINKSHKPSASSTVSNPNPNLKPSRNFLTRASILAKAPNPSSTPTPFNPSRTHQTRQQEPPLQSPSPSTSSSSSTPTPSPIPQVKTFTIPVQDYDRARLFYTEALSFQIWEDDYPLPTNPELLFFSSSMLSSPMHVSGSAKSETRRGKTRIVRRRIEPRGYFLRVNEEGMEMGNSVREGKKNEGEASKAKAGFVQLAVLGLRDNKGYERVLWVRDEGEKREVEARVNAANGEVWETTERIPIPTSHTHIQEPRKSINNLLFNAQSPGEIPRTNSKMLITRTKIQDTEGNVFELRCWS